MHTILLYIIYLVDCVSREGWVVAKAVVAKLGSSESI